MKKRLISALLALAMVATMVVLPVSAQEETVKDNVTAVTEQCPCGCGPISQADWKPYNLNDPSATSMGHYYLDTDYAQDGQKTVISGSDLVIDLRGHTLTTLENSRLFLVEGYLGVLDTVGGGRIQSKTSGGGYGGVVMVRMYETSGSTFELYSGTLTVDPDNKSSVAGGLVYVSGEKSTFRMYGGVIRDGSTTAKDSLSTNGGAIAAVAATTVVEILGGTIINCSSASTGGAIYSLGTTRLENCRIINCTSAKGGGAIYQSGAGLTMENVQIMSCESQGGSGGAIYSTGATKLTDCQILQCTAALQGGSIAQVGGSLTTENCDIAYGVCSGDSGGGNIYTTSFAGFTDNCSTIRDGAALGGKGSGGNVLIGAGTHTLAGTTIRGGVSQLYGANVVNWAATTTRLVDCEIDGDVRWSGAGLSLEGKTKIGLRNNGLNLVGGSAGSVISASKLTDGAEIFVSAYWGVFTNDEANLDYFKPALRTVLSKESDGTLSGKAAASGTEGGYCPHCYDPENPQKVTWQAYTAASDANISQSGHYYLSKACTARLNIMADTDVVIDLNGLNITSGHRALVLKKGAKLSVLDFNGAGKVTGKGGGTSGTPWNGGVIYGEGACDLNIYGGSYIYSSQDDKHIAAGGVVYAPAGSKVNIYGGSFDGSSYNKTGTTNIGGVVAFADGASEFHMTAGYMVGGHANAGGVMSFGTGNTVNITGGMITGGSTTGGYGNIRMLGSSSARGTAQLRDFAVVDGSTSSGGGGNLSAGHYDLRMDDCYFAGGSATYGGNVNQRGGLKASVFNTLFVCGTAPKGGNIYTAAIGTNGTYYNCTVLGGHATIPAGSTSTADGCGGNVYLNNGKVTFAGGEISLGVAQASGGNVYAYTGTNADGNKAGDKVILTADEQNGCAAPVISNGYAKKLGGNIYAVGVTHITDARIHAGRALSAGQDLYLQAGANTDLTIGAGVTGDIRMMAVDSLLGTPVYGNPVSKTSVNTLNAGVVLEDKGLPVFAHNGSLFAGGASVVNAEGEQRWYVDNAEAVAACGENEYVKLYTTDDLVLTKDLTVDLNGQTVAVSGNYQLSGMDSTGDGYELPTGKTTGAANIAPVTYAPNGNTYLAVKDGDSATYHRLGMAITDIALRPADAGLYYKAAFSADSVVKGMIAEYGIAASLVDMPKDNFRNDPNSDDLWVGFTGQITNGTKQCGVVIRNILKQSNTAANNNENGRESIFATAYVTLTDGTTYVARENIAYSLYDFMEQLDDLIQTDPTHFRKFEKRTKEFYDAWDENGMGDWTFNRLKAPEDPAKDNEFNVIMIGSSYAYYYVEELYALLVEAGYENVNVCNVYYSGCPMSSHYKWWAGNESNYQVFEVDSTGRKKISNAASLEYSLARRNWDVISLQEAAGGTIRKIGPEKHFENTMLYHSTLLPYLASEFPQARQLWHNPWNYEVGADRNGLQIPNIAVQHNLMLTSRAFSLMICQTYNRERVNTNEAWQLMREKYEYGKLCARLGNGTPLHSGDFSHDGDIGGGQLLNACVWYEIITGKDCTQTEFVPEYTYNGKVMENLFDAELIKSAAHDAVQTMKAGGCVVSLEPMPET